MLLKHESHDISGELEIDSLPYHRRYCLSVTLSIYINSIITQWVIKSRSCRHEENNTLAKSDSYNFILFEIPNPDSDIYLCTNIRVAPVVLINKLINGLMKMRKMCIHYFFDKELSYRG